MSLIDVAEDVCISRGNVKMAAELAHRSTTDFIWKAANVEGLGTTYSNTEAILNNLPVFTRRDEVLFILNMRDAWGFLLSNLEYNNCWMLLREFNNIVGRDLIHGCGALRRCDVSIDGTSWRPGIPVEADVYDSIKRINNIEEDVDRALSYFCFITRSQLFIDGNKRVAQLMANKVLIESGVGVLSIPVSKLAVFKDLLMQFYETDESDKLKDFLRTECITYIQ